MTFLFCCMLSSLVGAMFGAMLLVMLADKAGDDL